MLHKGNLLRYIPNFYACVTEDLKTVCLNFDITWVAFTKKLTLPENFNGILVKTIIQYMRHGITSVIQVGMTFKDITGGVDDDFCGSAFATS